VACSAKTGEIATGKEDIFLGVDVCAP
jgi:hypothetical protein